MVIKDRPFAIIEVPHFFHDPPQLCRKCLGAIDSAGVAKPARAIRR